MSIRTRYTCTNVRNVADIKSEFIATIKEHGVLEPIVAVQASDGRVLVRMGQRRTLAAREAGLTSVPVYVRPCSEGDDTAQLVERVTEQIVENDHREKITEAQRAGGIQQLLDAGVSVTKVTEKVLIQDARQRGWEREVERHQTTSRRLEQLLSEVAPNGGGGTSDEGVSRTPSSCQEGNRVPSKPFE
jgi:ParB-like nuclease family protein